MILCLHHTDADGLCSGAIVRHKFGDAVELHAIDYSYPIPWDKIKAAETVIIVDFSLPKNDMLKILRAKKDKFLWIDHHISAMRETADIDNLNGLRDIEEAACVLTWMYFFPDQDVPHAVRLIGDRDIWRFAYDETKDFCEGLYPAETTAGDDSLWKPILHDDQATIDKFIEHGKILFNARLKEIERRVKSSGLKTTFRGYKTMTINTSSSGDLGHYICGMGYDVAYVYSDIVIDGELHCKVTLYSDNVDVSALAKAEGGGGHKGAAGFRFIRTTRSPFPANASAEN